MTVLCALGPTAEAYRLLPRGGADREGQTFQLGEGDPCMALKESQRVGYFVAAGQLETYERVPSEDLIDPIK